MAKKLYLVAGHGAGDPGAIGNGYKEADVARQIVAALTTEIGSTLEVTVYDTSKDLYKSKEYSFFPNDAEVIEVHLNSFSNANAQGTEILIKAGYLPDTLDTALLNAMRDYFTDRGIKYRRDLANMNYFAEKGIGYRLIEVCFISNTNDMVILMGKFNEFIANMANKIIKAMNGTGTVADTTTIITTDATGNSYKVKVTVSSLNIRKGPGTNYSVVGSINDKGTYTIVQTSGTWGKLKSGIGWISLNYTIKV